MQPRPGEEDMGQTPERGAGVTQDDSWRRLTPEEIEALRDEMRAAGEWMKSELVRRRRSRRERHNKGDNGKN